MADLKGIWHKTWDFIWRSNSIWSWIVNIILAFVVIKFLLYPGLGLALGTTHPIVAVVSSSMAHDQGFDDWWNSEAICSDIPCKQSNFYQSYGITKQDFLEYKFRNGFNKGDIMVLYGKNKDIKQGEVVVFKSKRPDPIIHRIVKVEDTFFQTKGDHNAVMIKDNTLDESNIPKELIVGKAIFRVPYLGWIKIGFVDLINLIR